MGFPDRLERTVRIDRPLERVWAAITTAEGLGAWFAESAEIDLRVGGTATLSWMGGGAVRLRVERLEPQTVFAYTWGIYGLSDDDPRRTYVEFTLTPDDRGTTVTVVETGFAQLDPDSHRKAVESNTGGWVSQLDKLVAHLRG